MSNNLVMGATSLYSGDCFAPEATLQGVSSLHRVNVPKTMNVGGGGVVPGRDCGSMHCTSIWYVCLLYVIMDVFFCVCTKLSVVYVMNKSQQCHECICFTQFFSQPSAAQPRPF